jgi:PhnB protein
MTSKTKSTPAGYHSVIPYLSIANAAKAIAFYKEIFGATEGTRLTMPDGKVMHAEIRIGDSVIMMTEENPDCGSLGPLTIGGTPVSIVLYVEDADTVVNRAVAAGATLQMPVADMFWGDRCGSITDPFGHKWTIATHTEDVAPAELDTRFKALFAK